MSAGLHRTLILYFSIAGQYDGWSSILKDF